jgi:hypothetical protein
MEKQESSFLDSVKVDVANILINHKGVRTSVHDLLIKLAIHVENHGDVTGVQYVVDQLGTDDAKGLNNRAVADWLKAFTKVDIKYDKVNKVNKVTYAKSKVTELDKGKAKPWYEFRPSKINEGYNFRQMMEALYTGANKKLKAKTQLIKDGKLEEAAKLDITFEEVQAFGNFLHPKVTVVSTQFNAANAQREAQDADVIEITQLPASDAA